MNWEFKYIRGNFIVIERAINDNYQKRLINISHIVHVKNDSNNSWITLFLTPLHNKERTYRINIDFDVFTDVMLGHKSEILEKIEKIEKNVSQLAITVEYAPGYEEAEKAGERFKNASI